jgi:hypothetical protein
MIMDRPGSERNSFFIEQKPVYRADTDQSGDWYVWRRLNDHGWATHHRCDTREAAVEMAALLNRGPSEVA